MISLKSRPMPLMLVGFAIVIVFTLSFLTNAFNIADNRPLTDENFRFDTFEKGSQQLVVRKLEHVKEDNSMFQAQFGYYMINQSEGRLKIYSSQVGAHGLAFSIPVRFGLMSPAQTIRVAEILCAFASAVVLLMIPLWSYRNFGWLAAVIPAVLIFASVWITLYARNVFWMSFTFYLPFVYSLWRYPSLLDGKITPLRFHACVAGFVAMKALCGYEFISCVILAATVPVLFYGIWRGTSFLGTVWNMSKTLFVGAAAVIAVFGVHTVQHGASTGDWRLSSMPYYARAIDRGVGGVINPKTEDGQPGVSAVTIAAQEAAGSDAGGTETSAKKSSFATTLIARGSRAVQRYATYYLSQAAIALPFVGWSLSFGTLFCVSAALLMGIYLKSKGATCSPERRKLYIALLVSGLYSPLCSLSWVVAGLEHFLGHKWLNEIIFFMPMLLWIYVIMGIFVSDLIANRKIAVSVTSPGNL